MITIKSNIKALIFDCDGTLADSMGIHNNAWHTTLKKYNLEVPQSFFDERSGIPTKEIIIDINDIFSVNIDIDTFIQEREKLALASLNDVKPIKAVTDVARLYHGKLPMAVISGGIRASVIRSLEAIKLENVFDFIITADDDHPRKNLPEAFTRLAKMLNTDPENCMVFEDGMPGIQSARAIGMTALDVRPYYDA